MTHIKITIDIPDDTDFNWKEACHLWEKFMPDSSKGYGNTHRLDYHWKKECVQDSEITSLKKEVKKYQEELERIKIKLEHMENE